MPHAPRPSAKTRVSPDETPQRIAPVPNGTAAVFGLSRRSGGSFGGCPIHRAAMGGGTMIKRSRRTNPGEPFARRGSPNGNRSRRGIARRAHGRCQGLQSLDTLFLYIFRPEGARAIRPPSGRKVQGPANRRLKPLATLARPPGEKRDACKDGAAQAQDGTLCFIGAPP